MDSNTSAKEAQATRLFGTVCGGRPLSGYVFIMQDGNRQSHFCPFSSLPVRERIVPFSGDRVSFEISRDLKGRTVAINVRIECTGERP
jgi:hypothetical protein